MSTHIYWNEVKNLVRESFNQHKDLIDELNMNESEKAQFVSTNDKVGAVATSTFKECHSLDDFQTISRQNLESLREAAEILAGKRRDGADHGQAGKIVEIAKTRYKDHKTQMVLAQKLNAYASKLERAYSSMKKDLEYESQIVSQNLTRDEIESSLRIPARDVKRSTEHTQALKRGNFTSFLNLFSSQLALFSQSGEKTSIQPFTGEAHDHRAAIEHFRDEILKPLIENLGMLQSGNGEEPVFTEEADSILRDFESMNTRLFGPDSKDTAYEDKSAKGRLLADGRKEGSRAYQERMGNIAKEELLSFIQEIPNDTLRSLLDGSLLDTAEKAIGKLSGLPAQQASSKGLETLGKAAEIHPSDANGTKILVRNLFRPYPSSKRTLIESKSVFHVNPEHADTKVNITLAENRSSPEYRELKRVLELAGFEPIETSKGKLSREYIIQTETPDSLALIQLEGLRPGEVIAGFDDMEAVLNEIYRGSVEIIKRTRALCRQLNLPKEIEAEMTVRRAAVAEEFVAAGGKISGRGKIKMLLDAYGVAHPRDLPPHIRERTDKVVPEAKDRFGKYVSDLQRSFGTPEFEERFTRSINAFANSMGIDSEEWRDLTTSALPSYELASSLEKQLRFIGLHKIKPEEMRVVMNTALVTGIIKGTDPLQIDIVKGFLEQHAPRALGSEVLYTEELDAPLTEGVRNRIQEMKAKEMALAELCLYYDLQVSNFSEKFRQRTVEMMELIGEFRDKVENTQLESADSNPLPTTIEEIANHELAEMEPFQGDYYQGSIPVARIPAAIRDPDTNFRVKMWICANMDDLFEHFFIGNMPNGTPRIDAFEEFVKREHPEIDWLHLDKVRAQFEISRYVHKEVSSHRRELDEQMGLSIFHPRHPLTTHSRETGVYHERVHRGKVKQNARMKEEQAFEAFLRKNDIHQQNIVPLSLDEIERHQPEIYAQLGGKYDLGSPEGRASALRDEILTKQDVIPTKWGSGGWVWAMNEDALVSKTDGQELQASEVTKMLTRAVPMVGGISGHVEFIEHLATYFGMDRQDALITTFANLVMCNAHTIPEVVVGCSSFIDLIPPDVLERLEFNETMFPTLSEWIMRRVPEDSPARGHLEQIAEDISGEQEAV